MTTTILKSELTKAISGVNDKSFMFPFFDGLIPEGWLLDIAEKTWRRNPLDRMGLLLACCKDAIGLLVLKLLIIRAKYPVNVKTISGIAEFVITLAQYSAAYSYETKT